MSELIGRGGGGGDKPRKPIEDPNTLQSSAKAKILDMVAHGPIVGLVDGAKSIYLNDTPLQSENGDMNFSGITYETREGYPNQPVIPGFRSVETPYELNVQVKQPSPVVRQVQNPSADAVVVTVRIPRLMRQTDEGDILAHEVGIAFDFRISGKPWTVALTDTIKGKTMSPYERTYRIDIIRSVGPWEIRMRRTSEDYEDSSASGDTFWYLMTEVVDARLYYPDSALVGITLDAEEFGSRIPSRSYDMKLSIIKVPSNYNPDTRSYNGIWDGTFKMAWTDNPAWVYYDLATNPDIGAGLENVNKWALYEIAQYCDELVPDGYGGMEPRFTFNSLLGSREDAVNALSTVASCFRGMAYWGTNTMEVVADKPSDIRKLVTPANVINGEFEYSGTSLRERHSVAIIMWNDPEDNYKQTPEVVEDEDSIQLFGWRQVEVTAVGCTSRGQARRMGKWILYSEREETQTLTYKAAADHADLRPGDIIQVMDPDLAQARFGGRTLNSAKNYIYLDKVPEEVAGQTWFFSVILPNGEVEKKEVSRFQGDAVILDSDLSEKPIKGAVWVLSSTAIRPPTFRVVSNREEDGAYQITATEYDPGKYDKVEQDLSLPEMPPGYLPTGPIMKPRNLAAVPHRYLAGGSYHQALLVSWTVAEDARVTSYEAEYMGPEDLDWGTGYVGKGTSFSLKDANSGIWKVRVRSVTYEDEKSDWVTVEADADNLLMPQAPTDVIVVPATFSVGLYPRGPVAQMYEFWRSGAAISQTVIEDNAVLVATATHVVDTGLEFDTDYFYYIRGINEYGVSDWYPVQTRTKNEFDEIMDEIVDSVTGSDLFQDLFAPIENIEGQLLQMEEALEQARDLMETVGDESRKARDQFSRIWESVRELKMLGSVIRRMYEDGDRVTQNMVNTLRAEVENNYSEYLQLVEVTVGETSSLATMLTELRAQVEGNYAEYSVQVDAFSSELASYASDLTSLVASTDAGFASVSDQLLAVDNQFQSVAADISELNVWRGGASASLTSLEQTQVTQGEAISQQALDLSSFVGSTNSEFSSIRQTISDGDQAISQELAGLSASYNSFRDTNAADLVTINQAIADESQSRTQQISDLTTTFNTMVDGLSVETDTAVANLTDLISDETQARVTLGQQIDTRFNNNETEILGLQTSLSEEESARVSAINSLNASLVSLEEDILTEVNANISSLQDSFVTLEGSLAQQLTTVRSEFAAEDQALKEELEGDVEAARTYASSLVTSEASTRASADSALSSQINTVQSNLNEVSSTASTALSTANTADGKLNAMYTVRTEVTTGGRRYMAGIAVGVEANEEDEVESQILMTADRFALINEVNGDVVLPFVVDGGTTYINKARIKNADIDTLKLEGEAVIVPRFATGDFSASITIPSQAVTMQVAVICTFTQGSGRHGVLVNMYHNGVLKRNENPSANTTGAMAVMATVPANSGNHTFSVQSDSSPYPAAIGLLVMGAKR